MNGYKQVRKKIYYFNNPIECKIEDFVRKYEYDL